MPIPGAYAWRSSSSSAGVNSVGGRMPCELVDDRPNRGVQRDLRDGRGVSRPRGGRPTVTRFELLVEHRARPDLVPVVVFGLDPEDRDGRHLVLPRHLVGELERRQGFEQREQRTAEETRLLSGQDRDRLRIGEMRRRFDRPGRRLPPLLLSRDDRRDLGRWRGCACVRASTAAQSARSEGSPLKNGATEWKWYA